MIMKIFLAIYSKKDRESGNVGTEHIEKEKERKSSKMMDAYGFFRLG